MGIIKHKKENNKSIDVFKDQKTDGKNIEGGGDLSNPAMMDTNLINPNDPNLLNDPIGDPGIVVGSNTPTSSSGTIVHSSTG